MNDTNNTSNTPTLLGSKNTTNSDDSSKTSNQKLIAAFLIGLIVGGGSVWMWLSRSADTGDVGSAGDSEELNGSKELANILSAGGVSSFDSGNGIFVRDQIPGDRVEIDLAVLSNIGWVAIHEDRDGVPGNILGATLFDTGESSGTVELLRGTVEGGTYYAMLHDEADNGENGFDFDFKKDLPILDSSGDPIMMQFTATSAAASELQ